MHKRIKCNNAFDVQEFVTILCSRILLFGANEKYILFKYARYILKPDKLKHEGPIGFGYDPEKKNKILFPAKREKHFSDDITPLHLNANFRR